MAENKVALTKKELNSVFLRSYQALGCYTYDKQQGIAYLRAMTPALEKLYPEHDDLVEAMKRHNTMRVPHIALRTCSRGQQSPLTILMYWLFQVW